MSVQRRALRTIAVVTLAVPVVLAVYLVAVARGIAAAPRAFLATLLGATVIGSVYAEETARRAPAGVRRGLDALPAARVSPLRVAAVTALAVMLVGVGAPATPVSARGPGEAVVDAAKSYLGVPYRLGREGPNYIDCSGLVFRVFSDIGELPRVSGKRLRAVGYYKWFKTRGLTSKKEGQRGDLVVFGNGRHIGIYLGKGRVISAMVPRVRVHGLHDISEPFTTFLNVQWNVGDGTGGEADSSEGKGKKGQEPSENKPEKEPGNETKNDIEESEQVTEAGSVDGPAPQEPGQAESGLGRGFATGTMNLRAGADPEERIVGWVSLGSRFTITGKGESPSGALWYSIEMRNGKSGWVYSRWVSVIED